MSWERIWARPHGWKKSKEAMMVAKITKKIKALPAMVMTNKKVVIAFVIGVVVGNFLI